MFLGTKQDSRWTECSASLRKELLYVKMPRVKATILVAALDMANQDLFRKEILESRKAFVFCGSTDDWNKDLLTLKALPSSPVVSELILAIEAGLRNEAWVDWISRVNGPPREGAGVLGNVFGEEDFIL